MRALEQYWYSSRLGWHPLYDLALPFASLFYRLGQSIDSRLKANRAKTLPRPVISIGNLTVGGTGKTPLAVWLANQSIQLGKIPCVLTRGYGGSSQDPKRVEETEQNWETVGDEPLLLARSIPTGAVYIGKDRWQAGQLALEEEPQIDVFILDDGFQHRQLKRDADILLVDGLRRFGNGQVLPAGPLREPLSAASRATHIGVVTKSGSEVVEPFQPLPRLDFSLNLGPVGWRLLGENSVVSLESLPRENRVQLVSGIAAPDGFEKTADKLGLTIAGHSIYPDHHPYKISEIEAERESASREGARLLTTAKDAVRMEGLPIDWTPTDRPFIIELGVNPGDGAGYLVQVLKGVLGLQGSGLESDNP